MFGYLNETLSLVFDILHERAKHGYAKCLEEGSHANPVLQTKFEVFQGKNNLKQGWALKSCKSRSPFNDRQKEFLNEIFEEGEGSRQLLILLQRP